MIDSNCELCNAYFDSQQSNPKIFNRPLYETNNFVIVPSVGQLIEGQAMILSKIHADSLAAMTPIQIEECLKIIDQIIGKFKNDNVLLTEHGSFNQQKGGGCIEHTHIHVMPHFGTYYSILDGVFENVETISKYQDLYKIHKLEIPYILNINSQKQIRIYKAYNAHSQMMRRAICNKLEEDNWNWRTKEISTQELAKTVELWEGKM